MEINIKHTPAEVAALFGAMPDYEQAEFFNALHTYISDEYPEGLFGFSKQMEYIRDKASLTVGGDVTMRFIGGNY